MVQSSVCTRWCSKKNQKINTHMCECGLCPHIGPITRQHTPRASSVRPPFAASFRRSSGQITRSITFADGCIPHTRTLTTVVPHHHEIYEFELMWMAPPTNLLLLRRLLPQQLLFLLGSTLLIVLGEREEHLRDVLQRVELIHELVRTLVGARPLHRLQRLLPPK